jgi:hypothetical protein
MCRTSLFTSCAARSLNVIFSHPTLTVVGDDELVMVPTKRAALFTIPDLRFPIPGPNRSPHEIR